MLPAWHAGQALTPPVSLRSAPQYAQQEIPTHLQGIGIGSQRWIFLRGVGRHSSHWGSFPSRFLQAFPDAEIELLDLAGNGEETDRRSYLEIGAYALDLRQRSRFVNEGKVRLIVTSEYKRMASAQIPGLRPRFGRRSLRHISAQFC